MFHEERFRVLLGDYFDESLKGEDRLELERMVLSSARARELFWEAAEQHALGTEWALASLGRELMMVEETRERTRGRGWVKLAVAAGIAAMAGLPLWLALKDDGGEMAAVETTVEVEPVALLGLSSGAVWEDGANRLSGDTLPTGNLRLKAGTVRIDFYNGTRGWIQGPAEFQLVSPMEMKMNLGTLRMNVPPMAVGFRVTSGELGVTDLGTEFGLMAEADGRKEVHVFNGEVSVEQPELGITGMRLGSGKALKMEGKNWSGVPAIAAVFPDPAAVWNQVSGKAKADLEAWKAFTEKFSTQPGMLVHYLFHPGNPEGRVPNMVPGAAPQADGSLIGGEWNTGRWGEKSAVTFRTSKDRLRLSLPGEYDAMTFLVWLRLEDLPTALAPIWRGEADKQRGCIHWNIDQLGRVRMGVMTGAEEFLSPDGWASGWDLALSGSVMGKALGKWTHLAGVYDSRAQRITLWMDGRLIATKPLRHRIPAVPGISQIGSALAGDNSERGGSRSLGGKVDEVAVAGRAFTTEEIRAHYVAGRAEAGQLAEPIQW
ncbi:MAG: LamG domain-containing protein [Akkermansiaceae bacterium]|nr:LamG domain-containing protein [Akkermansiaceae bacterium]